MQLDLLAFLVEHRSKESLLHDPQQLNHYWRIYAPPFLTSFVIA
jgi:hypothetical protein